MNGYVNYGDVDYLEHGGCFIKKDTEVSGECYKVVEIHKVDSEEKEVYWVVDSYVDLSDGWIEWEKVKSYVGLENENENELPGELLAREALSYYGSDNFNGSKTEFDSVEEVIEELKLYGIE